MPPAATVAPAGRLAPVRGRLDVRAILGGLLVALAVAGVAWSGGDGAAAPGAQYLVAAEALSAGTPLSDGTVALEAMTIPENVAHQAFTGAHELVGASALSPLAAGELVQRSDVTFAGEGGAPHELSLSIPTDRAAGGRIRPGETVDLVATYGTGADAYSLVVVTGEVLTVGAPTEVLQGEETIPLTLALGRRDDVVAAAHAAEVGAVRLVRSRPGSPPDDVPIYRPPGSAEAPAGVSLP